jgi:hypothetical protein
MKYRRPDWILAAFYRKAFLLERLAQTIYEAPVPPEFKKKGAEEYLAAYQDALAQAAQPYEDQAVGVYVQAIEAARKLHVKNEWTKKIGESLARYRPREYPILKDAKARLLSEDLSPVAFADTFAGPTRRALPGQELPGAPAAEGAATAGAPAQDAAAQPAGPGGSAPPPVGPAAEGAPSHTESAAAASVRAARERKAKEPAATGGQPPPGAATGQAAAPGPAPASQAGPAAPAEPPPPAAKGEKPEPKP